MERTQLFDLMGELKLYGMKAAFDEIMATLSNASTNLSALSAICSRRDQREAGTLDQVPAHHRQTAACQGP